MTIRFTSFQPTDVPLLTCWLQQPHVRAFWDDGERDEAAVMEHYLAPGRRVEQFLVMASSRPTGYIQSYRIDHGHQLAHLCGATGETWGLDLLLGREEATGQGLGAPVIQSFVAWWATRRPDIGRWLTDPRTDHTRAIRAYQKASFVPLETADWGGHRYQIMVLDPSPTSPR